MTKTSEVVVISDASNTPSPCSERRRGIAYIPRGHGNLFVSHEMKHFVQVLYRSACIELYVIGGTTATSIFLYV